MFDDTSWKFLLLLGLVLLAYNTKLLTADEGSLVAVMDNIKT